MDKAKAGLFAGGMATGVLIAALGFMLLTTPTPDETFYITMVKYIQGHAYMIDVAKDKHPNIVMRKSAQATASEIILSRGLAVAGDPAPPDFALNETAVGDYRTLAKLSPPLRSGADREAIIEGLKDGTIDAIGAF